MKLSTMPIATNAELAKMPRHLREREALLEEEKRRAISRAAYERFQRRRRAQKRKADAAVAQARLARIVVVPDQEGPARLAALAADQRRNK